MKYPFVLFIRPERMSDYDHLVTSDNSMMTATCSENIDEVYGVYSNKYHVILRIGDDSIIYYGIPEKLMNRVLTLPEDQTYSVDEINNQVNTFYAKMCIANKQLYRPTFSIFTTCYNSYEKIKRAYNSLLSQTFIDWEWVIVDDSPEESHFGFLKSTLTDPRVRLYRRDGNSGSIGLVKNEAIALCRGDIIVEFDHDDELTEDCLRLAKQAFDADSDVGFVYMDFINMYEDEKPFFYGNQHTNEIFMCKGYGGYLSMRFHGKWHNLYLTPNVNNITMSHLVCLPNHPRIWRANVLREFGGYSELLPICDDLEILLQTLVKYKAAKVCKLGYIQYMNPGNNNFSLIRNSEINRIGPKFIAPAFFDNKKVDEVYKERDAAENPLYRINYSNIWTRSPNYQHKYWNRRFSNLTNSLLIFNPDQLDSEEIKDYRDIPNRMIYLISGDKLLQYLQMTAERADIGNIMVWSLPGASKTQIIRYVTMLVKAEDEEIIALAD
jgi:glycosyltransferase involved in cell wall biosynthesis